MIKNYNKFVKRLGPFEEGHLIFAKRDNLELLRKIHGRCKKIVFRFGEQSFTVTPKRKPPRLIETLTLTGGFVDAEIWRFFCEEGTIDCLVKENIPISLFLERLKNFKSTWEDEYSLVRIVRAGEEMVKFEIEKVD